MIDPTFPMDFIIPEKPIDFLDTESPALDEPQYYGIDENPNAEIVGIPVIYGYRRITGPRVYARTKSNDTTILYLAYALSMGPVTKFDKVFLDGKQLTFTSSTPNTLIGVSRGYFSNRVAMEFFYGDSTDGNSRLLTEVTGNPNDVTPFTNSMRGVAYIVLRLSWISADDFKQIPRVEVDVCGRKIRVADTNFATNPLTNQFSESNVADVLLDYLTNNDYGRGIADSQIDATSLSAMRTSFETALQSYTNGPTVKRGSCNYILDTNRSIQDNVNELCRQFNIIMTYANGRFRFTSEYASSTIAMTVTESMIIDGYTRTIPSINERLNECTIEYYDREIGFQSYTQTYSNSTFLSQDNDIKLNEDISLDAITNAYLARFYAESQVRKSRTQERYTWRMTKNALQLTVGDLVYFLDTSLTLRITDLSINDDFTVDIEAVKHSNANYAPFVLGSRETYAGGVGTNPAAPTPNPGVPTDPPPPPIIIEDPNDPNTATITVSGFSAIHQLTGGIGTRFYTFAMRNSRLNQDITNANFDIDTVPASRVTGDGTFGTKIQVKSQRSGNLLNVYYEYFQRLSYRHRDLGNTGQEGILVIGTNRINRIFYAYEIGQANGQPLYGWANYFANDARNTIEYFFFDPERDTTATRRTSLGSSTTNIAVSNCVYGQLGPVTDPGSASTTYGCPFLVYDNSRGYYTVGGQETSFGLKAYVTAGNSNSARFWIIPYDVYVTKRTLDNLNSLSQIKIKFFCLGEGGTPIFLGRRDFSLSQETPANTGLEGLITTSRNAYKLTGVNITPPF